MVGLTAELFNTAIALKEKMNNVTKVLNEAVEISKHSPAVPLCDDLNCSYCYEMYIKEITSRVERALEMINDPIK